MAEFLHILSEQYDYPQLADEILRLVEPNRLVCDSSADNLRRDLSNKEFNSNDTKGQIGRAHV